MKLGWLTLRSGKMMKVISMCLVLLSLLSMISFGYSTFNTTTGTYDTGSRTHMAYMKEKQPGKFMPEAFVTREEVAEVIAKNDILYDKYVVYTSENVNKKFNFTDVDVNRWSANYIGFVTKMNYFNGYDNNTFKPSGNLTKAELAVIIVKFKGLKTDNLNSKFSDVKGRWSEKYIAALEKEGFAIGYGDGKYRPDSYIDRKEFCCMMNRVLGRTPDKDKVKSLKNINKFTDISENRWYYAEIMEATNDHSIWTYNNIITN